MGSGFRWECWWKKLKEDTSIIYEMRCIGMIPPRPLVFNYLRQLKEDVRRTEGGILAVFLVISNDMFYTS